MTATPSAAGPDRPAEPAPPAPGTYRHFKGGRYEVIGTGRHVDTEEALVFYRTLYGDRSHWVRPVAQFVEHVTRDGWDGPRFVREEPQPEQPGLQPEPGTEP